MTCDLSSSKKCDNCGQCLELEGIDTKEVRINELIVENDKKDNIKVVNDLKVAEDKINQKQEEVCEKEDDSSVEGLESDEPVDLEYDLQESEESMDVMDNEELWDRIDDVEELAEIMADESIKDRLMDESFPGLYRMKGK